MASPYAHAHRKKFGGLKAYCQTAKLPVIQYYTRPRWDMLAAALDGINCLLTMCQ